jgi:hypothetical protein
MALCCVGFEGSDLETLCYVNFPLNLNRKIYNFHIYFSLPDSADVLQCPTLPETMSQSSWTNFPRRIQRL